MIYNQFLEDIGLTQDQYSTNFVSDDDPRAETWIKEKKEYGFDSRETWNMDHIFTEWLYSRLMMFNQTNGTKDTDTVLCIKEINPNTSYSIDKWIDLIITACKYTLKAETWTPAEIYANMAMEEAITIFSRILPYLHIYNVEPKDAHVFTEQNKKYGFNETECYILPQTYIKWLNSHTKLFDKVCHIIDTEFYHFNIHGKTMSQQECMEYIIDKTNYLITNKQINIEKYFAKINEISDVWKEIRPAMWW
jgi:hypothetical protein